MAQKHLQLLRNGTAFADYSTAYAALIAKTGSTYADGTPILARYTDNEDHQKTLLGVVNNGTVDVINNVSDYLLRGYTAYTESGRPIVISASDDVKTAIAKLDKKVAESSAAAATEVAEGTDAGNNMTIVPTTGASGQKIYTINLSDVASASGLDAEISARKAVDGVNGDAYVADDNSNYLTGATSLYDADSKLDAALAALETKSGFHIVEEAGTGTVLKQYKLLDGNNNQSGDTIVIYKDSSLVSMELVEVTGATGNTQVLRYTYIDASGATRTTDVDVSLLLSQNEFKSGVTANNAGVVHGVVDETSETVVTSYNADGTTAATSNVLTVGADGFKVGNIQAAIDAKVNTLDVADTANDNQYVSSVSETDGKISVSRTNLVNGKLSGYTKGSDATAVSTGDTLGQAIGKLENQIDKAKAAATTVVQEGMNNPHMTITSSADTSTSATTYTITLTDVASDTALTAEIAARKAVDGQNGQTYAANAGTNYISNATSLNDADVKLDTALYGLSGKSVTGVEMTGGTAAITANTDGTKKITINTDGSQLYMTNYASGNTSSAVTTGDTVNEAIGKLENQIKDAKAAATTVVEHDTANVHVTVTGTPAADGHMVYTVEEDDIASETEMHNTFGTGVTTANTATAQFKDVNDKLGTGVTTSNTVTSQLQALSGNNESVSGDTSVEGAKRYAEAILHTAVDGLDAEKSTYSVSTKQFATYIKQVDGEIIEFSGRTVSASDVVNVSQKAPISGAGTVQAALDSLADLSAAITIGNADDSINVTTGANGTDINVNIKSGEKVIAKDGGNGLYTDIKLSGITPSSTTIKDEYALIGTDGTQLGDSVKIYKDSSLVSMELVSGGTAEAPEQYLRYIYVNNSGDTAQTDVDVSLLLAENEFKSGTTVTPAGIVRGVVDPTSESFLTVGADGFKLSGVQDAIDDAVTGITSDTTVTADQYITGITQTNGVVSVTSTNISGAHLVGYDNDGTVTGDVASTDSINDAISKLENQIDAAKTAATTRVVTGQSADTAAHLEIAESTGATGNTYTIDLKDVASATALTAETAARKAVDGQNGDTYAANSGKKYISGATSLNDADIKLNDAIATIEGSYLTNVVVNDVAGTVANHVATVDIDGGDIKLSGYTGNETGAPETGDTVNAAIAKLYNKSVQDHVVAGSATTVTTASTGTIVDVKLDTTSEINEYDATHAQAVNDRSKNVLEITANGLYLNNNWDCGIY